MMRLIILSLLSLLMVGCGSKEVIVQTEYEYVNYYIPSYLMSDCETNEPDFMLGYERLPIEDREVALTEYIVSLYRDVSSCNFRLKELRDYVKDREGVP